MGRCRFMMLLLALLTLSQVAMASAEVDDEGTGGTQREIYIAYEGNVATYYYDDKRYTHDITGDPNTKENHSPEKPDGASFPNKVVIDPSMADARPVMETTGMFFFGIVSENDEYNVKEIVGLEYLNTSESVSLEGMFHRCKVKSLDLSHFNTDKVKNMKMMFSYCTELINVEFGDNFNTENVTNMQWMFTGTNKIRNLNLEWFNTANVTNMYEMFEDCGNLTTVVVGNGWTVKNVTDCDGMFSNCYNIKGSQGTTYATGTGLTKSRAHVDGGSSNPGYFWNASSMTRKAYAAYDKNETLYFFNDYWNGKRGDDLTCYDLPTTRTTAPWKDVSSAITTVEFTSAFATARPVSTYGWFSGMSSLETIKRIDWLNTSEVTDMSSMFYNCSSLTSLDVSGFNTQKVTDMSNMFYNCKQVKDLDVSGFSTSEVKNMAGMFEKCAALKTIDVSDFSTNNVTNMGYMFSECTNLKTLDVSKFYTENVESMESMFKDCSSLEALNVSGFNTTNSTRMHEMFSGCSGLTALDVSGFNTVKAEWMNDMFEGCSNLEALDVSGFNTDACLSMAYMFQNCKKLTEIDVSNFNTENVTTLANMFYGCSSITELDLSNFNTAKVTDMSDMFNGCSNLQTIYVSDKYTTDVVKLPYGGKNMFSGCEAIVGGMGTTYSSNNVTYLYACIDGVNDHLGYFTNNEDRFYAYYDNLTHTLTFMGDCKSSEHTIAGQTEVYELDSFYENSSNSFYDRKDWQKVVVDETFAKAKVKSMYGWFYGCKNLKEIDGLENINVSSLTDVTGLFYNCAALDLLDLSKLNLKSISNLQRTSMFYKLNPDCVLYLPSGMSASDFANVNDGELEDHSAYNLVLDEDGDGKYECADLRLADGPTYLYPIVTPFHADKVTYNREFTIGRRATVYLPFAFNATQFGKIYDYKGKATNSGISFYPVSGTTTTPNTPYIIDPNGSVIEAQDVDVAATCDTEPTGGNEMIGVCRRGKVPEGAYAYDATSGVLKHVTADSGTVNISAFRAYFLLPALDAAGSKTISTFFEETTGIARQETVSPNTEWYTISGQRLNSRPDSKGIYIVNGKKYMVK